MIPLKRDRVLTLDFQDVIARCMPPAGSVDPPFGLSTVDICTQTDMSILDDGWRSFPSGHSSCKSNHYSLRLNNAHYVSSFLRWSRILVILCGW